MISFAKKVLADVPLLLFGHSSSVSNSGGSGKSSEQAKQYQLIGPHTNNNPDNVDFLL